MPPEELDVFIDDNRNAALAGDGDDKPVDKREGEREGISAREKRPPKNSTESVITLTTTKIEPETVLTGSLGSYAVIGAFGSTLYACLGLVEDMEDKTGYVIKYANTPATISVLKFEMHVMAEIKTGKHFRPTYDIGNNKLFKFVVMEAYGRSLHDIRKRVLKGNFSRSTAMWCGINSLEAIMELHGMRFLHRDIRSQNFVVGPGKEKKFLYLIDFSCAYKYMNEKNQFVPQREKRLFRGTIRWASRSNLKNQDLSRKDDLECWLYMVCDLIDDGVLPWKDKDVTTREAVLDKKEAFFAKKKVDAKLPANLSKILQMIDSYTFSDCPDYYQIMIEMMEIVKSEELDMRENVDWMKDSRPKDEMVLKQKSPVHPVAPAGMSMVGPPPPGGPPMRREQSMHKSLHRDVNNKSLTGDSDGRRKPHPSQPASTSTNGSSNAQHKFSTWMNLPDKKHKKEKK